MVKEARREPGTDGAIVFGKLSSDSNRRNVGCCGLQAVNDRFKAWAPQTGQSGTAAHHPSEPSCLSTGNGRKGAGAAVRISEIEWRMSDREQSDGLGHFGEKFAVQAHFIPCYG
jgi:hypothetical protein